MAYTHFERLSALDATFLAIENHDVHMHVGSVGLFEVGPLPGEDGALDIARIRTATESALQNLPRFRQRLAWIPFFDHPVWVDDERFNIHYHVRHTALPRPGDERQLKRLAGRILSQQLDRGKPLWEMWFVEGLEGDRFAVVTKVHHCLIDGISGVDLLVALLRTTPDPTVEPPRQWIPRPVPNARQLLAGELARRATLPAALLGAARGAVADPLRAARKARDALEGLAESVVPAVWPASSTPLNPDVGPYRRFDWTRFDLDAVKEVKNRLGGTVNDVVVAAVTGALRTFLHRRGVRGEDLQFRAMLPVNTRRQEEYGRLGNRVSFLLAELPLAEADPRRRLERVTETTQRLKESKQVHGFDLIEKIADWTSTEVAVRFARLGARARTYNVVVTNVPGPHFPAFLLGARMLEIYPVVPLYTNQALGIALFSYDGGLFWGFNSDWDAVPDLHDMVEAVQSEFEVLRKAAAEGPVSSSRRRRTRRSPGSRGPAPGGSEAETP